MTKAQRNIAESRDTTLYRSPKSGFGCHYYAIVMEQTLFGDITVTRSWGPLNGTARTCQWVYRSRTEALAEFRRLVRIARKRGYKARIPRFKPRCHPVAAAPAPDDRQLALL